MGAGCLFPSVCVRLWNGDEEMGARKRRRRRRKRLDLALSGCGCLVARRPSLETRLDAVYFTEEEENRSAPDIVSLCAIS